MFTIAGRSAGASIVNRQRLLVAAVLATLIHWVTRGVPIPAGLSPTVWTWLALSGVLGLALGDDFLFRAFVRIGPALSMLVFALSPALAAMLGWLFLGESLSTMELAGMALTLGGIAWVVTAPRNETPNVTADRSFSWGLLFALGGAVGQALGLVTAKLGLVQGASSQAANWIRLVAAALAVWLLTMLTGRARQSFAMWTGNRTGATSTVLGAVVGPVAGVWLSLVAIERAPIGIASTLMSLTPLFLLPIGRMVFHEPITFRAVAGTILALAGVALLLQ